MRIEKVHPSFMRTSCFDHLVNHLPQNSESQDSVETDRTRTDDSLFTGAELKLAASRWVSRNSDWDEAGDDLFPHPESGESGTEAHLLEGASAQRAIDFTKAISLDNSIDFDPKFDAIVTVGTTEDEEELLVSILDRRTGSVENIGGGELGVTDYEEWVSPKDFADIFPPQKFPELVFGEVSAYEVIDALTDGSPKLNISEPFT